MGRAGGCCGAWGVGHVGFRRVTLKGLQRGGEGEGGLSDRRWGVRRAKRQQLGPPKAQKGWACWKPSQRNTAFGRRPRGRRILCYTILYYTIIYELSSDPVTGSGVQGRDAAAVGRGARRASAPGSVARQPLSGLLFRDLN